MKKVMSTLLALVMVFAMCIPTMAFAGDASQKYNVGFNGQVGHTYAVYKIMGGTYDSEKGTFADPYWAEGFDSAKYCDDKSTTLDAEINKLTSDSTYVATFARNIGNGYLIADNAIELDNTGAKSWTATEAEQSKTVYDCDAGYYMIVDITEDVDMPDTEAYSGYLLGVANTTDVKISPKNSSTPDATKKVSKVETGGTVSDMVVSSIGGTVYFTLTATLPSSYSAYPSYKLTFNDTLPAGLTLTSSPVVKVNGVEIASNKVDINDSSEILDKDSSSESSFEIGFSNLKSLVPSAASSQEVTVTYAAMLDKDAVIADTGNANTMYLTYSNNPNKGIEGTTNTSTVQKATVYTYRAQIAKVDNSNIIFTDRTTEGSYATFKLYSNESLSADSEIKLVEVDADNGVYRPALDGETGVEIKAGLVTVQGLDNGTYYLEEQKAPVGYTSIAKGTVAGTFSISNANNDVMYTTVSSNKVYQSGGVKVVNLSGKQLPVTGGMGTIIFTVVGLVLVIGAGTALVIRRRMKANSTK